MRARYKNAVKCQRLESKCQICITEGCKQVHNRVNREVLLVRMSSYWKVRVTTFFVGEKLRRSEDFEILKSSKTNNQAVSHQDHTFS